MATPFQGNKVKGLIALLGLCAALGACGQRGPLKAPSATTNTQTESQVPGGETDPTLEQTTPSKAPNDRFILDGLL